MGYDFDNKASIDDDFVNQQDTDRMNMLRENNLSNIADTVLSQNITDYQTGRIAPDKNSLIILKGKVALEALGNKVCVVQDEFRSGYECKRCGGIKTSNESRQTTIPCEECLGQGSTKSTVVDGAVKTCHSCKGIGHMVCPDCNGKGGLLITPDTAKTRPSTGRVFSIGPEVKIIKVGDYVMYTNYAGSGFHIKDSAYIVLLSEQEIIGRLYSLEDVNLGQAVI